MLPETQAPWQDPGEGLDDEAAGILWEAGASASSTSTARNSAPT